ncbi:cytochrome c biogenesis CcdA family protein [Mycobacterium sp. C31M]
MALDLIGPAFGAGLVAAVNPCGFAMLPGYLALVVTPGDGLFRAVGRAAAATVTMTLGVLPVFAAFGALTVSLASIVQRYVPFATVVIGAALVLLGGWLLSGRTLGLPLRAGSRWAPTGSIGSMLFYGIGFALASLSCTVGPFLAVTASAARGGGWAQAVPVYVAYAAGFAVIVGALAVSLAVTSTAMVDRIRGILPHANRFGGALLVLVGLYVGYYGAYEIRLFHGDALPVDPVVAAAGRVQGALAAWVHAYGGWPWLVLLAAALGAGAVIRRAARSRRRSGPPP